MVEATGSAQDQEAVHVVAPALDPPGHRQSARELIPGGNGDYPAGQAYYVHRHSAEIPAGFAVP